MTDRKNNPPLPPDTPTHISEAYPQTLSEKPVSSTGFPRDIINNALGDLYRGKLATQGEPEKSRAVTAENVLSSREMREVYGTCHDKEAFDGCIQAALFLFSQVKDPVASMSEIAEILRSIDFNQKEAFKSSPDEDIKSNKRQIFTDLAIDYWQKELGVDFDSSTDNALVVGEKVVEALGKTFYHGTNSTALESIKENGISRGEKGYEEDIENILSIIKRIGESEQILGWYKLNSEGRIFVTGNPDLALNYAKRSPEWFSVFTHKWNQAQRYENRDYQETKRYLEERISKWSVWEGGANDPYGIRKNLTVDEAEAIRLFFEKYWDAYGKSDPCIIQIEMDGWGQPLQDIALQISRERNDEAYKTPKDQESAKNYVRENSNCDEIRSAIKSYMMMQFQITDRGIEDKDIAPGDFRYFTVPRYDENAT